MKLNIDTLPSSPVEGCVSFFHSNEEFVMTQDPKAFIEEKPGLKTLLHHTLFLYYGMLN